MTDFYQRTSLEIRDVEKPAVKYAESRGWFQCKFVSPGKDGVPDRFFARAGRVVLVEFKAEGKKPRPLQLERHAELRAHGVEVHVIDNLEDAKKLLR